MQRAHLLRQLVLDAQHVIDGGLVAIAILARTTGFPWRGVEAGDAPSL